MREGREEKEVNAKFAMYKLNEARLNLVVLKHARERERERSIGGSQQRNSLINYIFIQLHFNLFLHLSILSPDFL